MSTATIVTGMLQENTGRHFLDSGDAYGRNWQRNQGRVFEGTAPATLSFRDGFIEVTYSLFHWLTDKLDFDAEMQALYDEHAAAHPDEHDLANMNSFAEYLTENDHGEYTEILTDNSYNHECNLSQTIQYTVVATDEDGSAAIVLLDGSDAIVLLQVHGGADVRGGYTAPKVFRPTGEWYEFTDFARGNIGCDTCDAWWTTDDGCHWYFEGSCGMNAGKQLETYPIVKHDAEPDEIPEGPMILCDDDGRGTCPKCSQGHLVASW